MNSAPIDLMPRDTMVRELLRPLGAYLAIPGATEIVVNAPGEVFVEVGPVWERHAEPGLTISRLISLATAIATFTDQEISAQRPILSAMLPQGERIQILFPPVVEPDTVSLTIRLPSPSVKTLDAYAGEGAFGRFVWAKPDPARLKDLSELDRDLIGLLAANDLAGFLKRATEGRKNIAIVGETGSGKTTLMKTICQLIPPEERLITIEDVRELFLPNHANSVHLIYSKGGQGVAQVTPADLISSAMRMKPDRVLLAELRGAEAFDFLKLLTTGHSGSVTSFHAESCALAADRYVFMCKEHADAQSFDAQALKTLVTLTVDVIVHVAATITPDKAGVPRKERYVSEVHFDPVAKLKARFGEADLHVGGTAQREGAAS